MGMPLKNSIIILLTLFVCCVMAATINAETTRNKAISSYYLASFEELLDKQAKADGITARKIADSSSPKKTRYFTGYYFNEILSRLEQLPKSAENDFKIWIQEKAKFLPSFFLMELGKLEFQTNPQKGLKWYAAGQIRALYDAKRCADPNAAAIPKLILTRRYSGLDLYAKLHPKNYFDAQEEALKWDQANEYTVSPIWMCAYSQTAINLNGNEPQEVKVGSLLQPEANWGTLRAGIQEEWAASILGRKIPKSNQVYL